MTEHRKIPALRRAAAAQPARTVERIIDATFTVLGKSGAKGFSFAELALAAGISRPTLYRHFPTKEMLLESLCYHVMRRYQASLTEAMAANPHPDNRLDLICYLINSRPEMQKVAQLLKIDPGFVLTFFQQQRSFLLSMIGDALTPVFDVAEERLGHPVDRDFVTDILTRLQWTLVVDPIEGGIPAASKMMSDVARALLIQSGARTGAAPIPK